jgi:hypothetical protein
MSAVMALEFARRIANPFSRPAPLRPSNDARQQNVAEGR